MDRTWEPIKDYQLPPTRLADRELRALSSVWIEQKTTLGESVGVANFNERLRHTAGKNA